jgi:hypothetical protein
MNDESKIKECFDNSSMLSLAIDFSWDSGQESIVSPIPHSLLPFTINVSLDCW